jgi:hypothetical protein
MQTEHSRESVRGLNVGRHVKRENYRANVPGYKKLEIRAICQPPDVFLHIKTGEVILCCLSELPPTLQDGDGGQNGV